MEFKGCVHCEAIYFTVTISIGGGMASLIEVGYGLGEVVDHLTVDQVMGIPDLVVSAHGLEGRVLENVLDVGASQFEAKLVLLKFNHGTKVYVLRN